MKLADIPTGHDISVSVGGAAAHSCVVSSMIHGTIESATAKAVKIVNPRGFFWVPRAALLETDSDWFKLARWFRPDAAQGRAIDRMTDHNGLSA